MVDDRHQQGTDGRAREARTFQPVLTRRRLLAGTGATALLAFVPLACAPVASHAWADGTFWDDGFGWAD